MVFMLNEGMSWEVVRLNEMEAIRNATAKPAIVQRLWDVLIGRQPEPEIREYHIIVTVFYISATMLLARLLRIGNCKYMSRRVQPYTADAISTFQSIACGLENGFVRRAYGMGAYCVQSFFLGYWASHTFGDSCSNPIRNFRKYMEGKQRLLRTVVLMSIQMVAGQVAFAYARQTWRLELSSEHAARFNEQTCESHLNVPVMLGLAIELSATVIDSIIAKTTTKRFMFERYEPFAKGIFGIMMTLAGLNLTGMYLNPANATAQTWNCVGNTKLEYVLVYWIGPLVGVSLGVVIHEHLRRLWHALAANLHQTSKTSSTAAGQTDIHLVSNGTTRGAAVAEETKKNL
ncbi:aquaporin-11-like [Tubulanus polymorphus]|uniref:aquaporin-11-like n=1 Tax=Tubulanus polymorphus TaxID=672921 RepID=UPI003DA69AFA